MADGDWEEQRRSSLFQGFSFCCSQFQFSGGGGQVFKRAAYEWAMNTVADKTWIKQKQCFVFNIYMGFPCFCRYTWWIVYWYQYSLCWKFLCLMDRNLSYKDIYKEIKIFILDRTVQPRASCKIRKIRFDVFNKSKSSLLSQSISWENFLVHFVFLTRNFIKF